MASTRRCRVRCTRSSAAARRLTRVRNSHDGGQTPVMAGRDVAVRICVVGCGAVGSLFAANLAQLDDVEVWAYDLAREHVDAINAHGLRLSGAGEVVGRVRATAAAQEVPPCDFGIVATKAMHTSAAVAAIALDADPEQLIDHAARKDVAYDHKASMLQDVEARQQTEVDFLNGGIVRFGEQHGV